VCGRITFQCIKTDCLFPLFLRNSNTFTDHSLPNPLFLILRMDAQNMYDSHFIISRINIPVYTAILLALGHCNCHCPYDRLRLFKKIHSFLLNIILNHRIRWMLPVDPTCIFFYFLCFF